MKWEVAVIGGGVIGASVAYELARVGRIEVVVVDDPGAGGAASRAAVGLIVTGGLTAPGGFWFSLRQRSASMWREWVKGIEECSGMTTGFHAAGALHLALTADEARTLRARVTERPGQAGAAEWIEGEDLHRLDGRLLPSVVGAARFAADAFVHPEGLHGALRRACESSGVVWKFARVEQLCCEQQWVRLVLADGEEVTARRAVVAAGSGSRALLASAGCPLPLVGVQGERVATELCESGPPLAMSTSQGAVFARGATLVIGGNKTKMEPPGRLTAEGVRQLLELSHRVYRPEVLGQVVEAVAGVRPCSKRRHPLIGFIDERKRVLVATGHYRSGFLWAPLTAKLVRHAIMGEASAIPLAAFAW